MELWKKKYIYMYIYILSAWFWCYFPYSLEIERASISSRLYTLKTNIIWDFQKINKKSILLCVKSLVWSFPLTVLRKWWIQSTIICIDTWSGCSLTVRITLLWYYWWTRRQVIGMVSHLAGFLIYTGSRETLNSLGSGTDMASLYMAVYGSSR